MFLKAYKEKDGEKYYYVLADRSVQSFMGSRSLEYNLQFLPKEQRIFESTLQESDKNKLLEDLNVVLPEEHLDRIWEMIWGRWKRYVQICDQKQNVQ